MNKEVDKLVRQIAQPLIDNRLFTEEEVNKGLDLGE